MQDFVQICKNAYFNIFFSMLLVIYVALIIEIFLEYRISDVYSTS